MPPCGPLSSHQDPTFMKTLVLGIEVHTISRMCNTVTLWYRSPSPKLADSLRSDLRADSFNPLPSDMVLSWRTKLPRTLARVELVSLPALLNVDDTWDRLRWRSRGDHRLLLYSLARELR